jgi:hypothetical protein
VYIALPLVKASPKLVIPASLKYTVLEPQVPRHASVLLSQPDIKLLVHKVKELNAVGVGVTLGVILLVGVMVGVWVGVGDGSKHPKASCTRPVT